jgi:hypothetical protein
VNVDLERVFDIIYHGYKIGGDYAFSDTLKLNKQQQINVVKQAIQAFMQSSGKYDREQDVVIQAFSGSADLPQLTKDVFNVTHAVPEFDTWWQESFQGVRLMQGQLQWEIADVETGMTVELVPEGGKCKIYSVSGSVVDAKIDKYGMGVGVTWEMIEGRKLYQFINLMNEVRAKLNGNWADTHYTLLQAAATLTAISWSGAATDPIIDRDIATINEGYQTIGEAVKDKGYGDVANVMMLLYASPNLKARIMQALRATRAEIIGGRRDGAATSTAGQVVEYNVQPRFTYNSAITADTALLILPGHKIQNAVYLRELGLQERDIETLSEIRTYWTAYGAIVADTDQCVELEFS